jgi:hypothetical protein
MCNPQFAKGVIYSSRTFPVQGGDKLDVLTTGWAPWVVLAAICPSSINVPHRFEKTSSLIDSASALTDISRGPATRGREAKDQPQA